MFICLWGFTSHSRIFHSYGDVTITGEGLQILTHTGKMLKHICTFYLLDICSTYVELMWIFSTHGHWIVTVVSRATLTLTRDINDHPPFVTTRPISLRNNLVNRVIEIRLKSFAGSYSAYKYFFLFKGLKSIFQFTKDLIIDCVSSKAHFLHLKL